MTYFCLTIVNLMKSKNNDFPSNSFLKEFYLVNKNRDKLPNSEVYVTIPILTSGIGSP